MDFRFTNLLGAPYRGGNLLLQGTELLSAVGNRVSLVDLTVSESVTLPFECAKQIKTLCLSPDGRLLLAIDEDGRSLLINKPRQALLHHFSFKGPVLAAKFSPDGQYIACAVGRLLQVWRAPGLGKSIAPMHLHRTYGGCQGDITTLAWSPDSLWLAVGSKDLTARVFSLNPITGYAPPTLAGHREALAGVFFAGPRAAATAASMGTPPPDLLTVSRDGALFTWAFSRPDDGQLSGPRLASLAASGTGPAANGQAKVGKPGDEDADGPRKRQRTHGGRAVAGSDGRAGSAEQSGAMGRAADEGDAAQARLYAGGRWRLAEKHFFNQRGARLSAVDYHAGTCMLVAGFTSGVFDLYELPAFQAIHTLSASRAMLSAVSLSPRGDWLALGCAALGQLLVWEWRSESYILRQQGHHHDAAALAFSPDGALLATGADDAKVKLWTVNSGFCYVTFTAHTAPVTGVAFLPSAGALASCSLDGTVRAWDLLRYRNFRTMTTPQPVQFSCLAVDSSGEVVVAGSADTFQVYVWSVQTGRLLDALAGHEGPVVSLAFAPGHPTLASASWDKTARTWDVFSGRGRTEVLAHAHDALALAWAPDGKTLAVATLDAQISLWAAADAQLQGTIEGRRDIAGGRLAGDRRAAGNRSGGQAFTSLAFSADGAFLLAGGNSKFICLYDVAERLLLRRFQVSHNRSLDGVLDVLNSRDVTDAGPTALLDDAVSDDDNELLPSTTAGGPAGAGNLPGTGGRRRASVRTRAVALSPTGRVFAAAATDGVLLFSQDAAALFDPTDLAEDVTPQAAHAALAAGTYLKALLIALRLGDADLTRHIVLSTPPAEVESVARGVPRAALGKLLGAMAGYLPVCPHLEFLLRWLCMLCIAHGPAIQALPRSEALPALRAVIQAVTRAHEDLAAATDSNLYTLRYLRSAVGGPAAAPSSELVPAKAS